ncbi:MAG: hypothetical protein KatS3mg118_2624 [Paracoccaceae bacterium]|nr:MAG: hypothetical protein KatS3mg118_2624 [Paracoccaceae bacterium]
MTPKEAANFGVPEECRRYFLRIEDAKVNLAPAGAARWFRMVGMPLDNGAGYWPTGDYVGVAEAWTPPTAQTGTAADRARVQEAFEKSLRPFRADPQSSEWIGRPVAEIMGLDVGDPDTPSGKRTPAQAEALARVNGVVSGWIRNGGLVVREERDPASRKTVKVFHAGIHAALIEPHGSDAAENPEDATETAAAGVD